jgi:hypothetical protein
MDAILRERAWSKQAHPGSGAVGTECGGVHTRASKTGINVWGCSNPYSAKAVVWS